MIDLNLAKYFSPELAGCIMTCTYKNADLSTLYTWMTFTNDVSNLYSP